LQKKVLKNDKTATQGKFAHHPESKGQGCPVHSQNTTIHHLE